MLQLTYFFSRCTYIVVKATLGYKKFSPYIELDQNFVNTAGFFFSWFLPYIPYHTSWYGQGIYSKNFFPWYNQTKRYRILGLVLFLQKFALLKNLLPDFHLLFMPFGTILVSNISTIKAS